MLPGLGPVDVVEKVRDEVEACSHGAVEAHYQAEDDAAVVAILLRLRKKENFRCNYLLPIERFTVVK